jgi:hypothetical protein
MKENLTSGEAPSSDSVFSLTYLGAYVGQPPDYIITDGPFAYWDISRDEQNHFADGWRIRNVFGYLRHPLSLNKSPFLTRRGGHFCGFNISLGEPNMWNKCLRVGDNIRDWTLCVDQYVHGPAHASIAGSWRRPGQTFDSPYCAQWFGVVPPPSTLPTMGTFIHAAAHDCFDCPECPLDAENSLSNPCMCVPKSSSCGPLWTGLVTSNSSRNESSLESFLVGAQEIQIVGDFGDLVASPNDPM